MTVTQLAKRDAAPNIITDPKEYTEAIADWRGRYHILTPFADLSGLAEQHAIIWAVVKIDPNYAPDGPRQVYGNVPWLKGKPGSPDEQLSLAKLGLRAIAEAGGISTSSDVIKAEINYWLLRGAGSYKGLDGSTIVRSALFEWDLRDGQQRAVEMDRPQLSQARKHGIRHGDSRAINAAIRECGTGIKQAYTRRELERAFVACRVIFQANMSDPVQAKAVVDRQYQGTSLLYPAGATSTPIVINTGDDAGVLARDGGERAFVLRDVGRGSTASTKAADPGPTYPQDVAVIEKYWTTTIKNGAKTKYHVTHIGAEKTTVYGPMGEHLKRLADERVPVEIVAAKTGYGDFNIEEIVPFTGQEQSLPLDEKQY